MDGQETEVKFYVRQIKRVEERLQALGARLIQPRVYEVNLRFDLPDGSLRREEKVLRLRQDAQARLTYKGPSQQTADVLIRPEIEITVDNFEAARNFLEALGYIPVATYEKYRSTYELGELHIMLDELPYGDFVEIEGTEVCGLAKGVSRTGAGFQRRHPAQLPDHLRAFLSEPGIGSITIDFLSAKRVEDRTRRTFSTTSG